MSFHILVKIGNMIPEVTSPDIHVMVSQVLPVHLSQRHMEAHVSVQASVSLSIVLGTARHCQTRASPAEGQQDAQGTCHARRGSPVWRRQGFRGTSHLKKGVEIWNQTLLICAQWKEKRQQTQAGTWEGPTWYKGKMCTDDAIWLMVKCWNRYSKSPTMEIFKT